MKVILTQVEPRLFEIQTTTRNGAVDTEMANEAGDAERILQAMCRKYDVTEVERSYLANETLLDLFRTPKHLARV